LLLAIKVPKVPYKD